MQIESEHNIGLERTFRPRGERRRKGQTIDKLLKLPVRLMAQFHFFTRSAEEEARSITVTELPLSLPGLPADFEGLKIAFLTDLHAGHTTPGDFLMQVVRETNRYNADLVLLGGDYVTNELDYLPDASAAIRALAAPMGVFGVLGNHDYWVDPAEVHCMLEEAGVVDVTNSGRWLHRGNSRIRIAGISDLWEDTPDLSAAMAGVKDSDFTILLAHNPDYTMQLSDPRVKLVLSGHTHGGQICLPRFGPVITNSSFGRKVVAGHVQFPTFQLYTSRGIGTVVAPMRYQCPPEIVIATLRRGTR